MRNIFLDKNDWLKFSKQWNSTLQLWSRSKLRSLQGYVRIKMSLNFILFKPSSQWQSIILRINYNKIRECRNLIVC